MEMLKVIFKIKGGKYKYRFQIIVIKMGMWEVWKEEMEVFYIFF